MDQREQSKSIENRNYAEVSWRIQQGDPGFVINDKNRANLIGRGGNGMVVKATFFGATVAAKTLFMIQNPDMFLLDEQQLQLEMEELAKELEIQSKLHHPNLVHFVGAVFNQNNLP